MVGAEAERPYDRPPLSKGAARRRGRRTSPSPTARPVVRGQRGRAAARQRAPWVSTARSAPCRVGRRASSATSACSSPPAAARASLPFLAGYENVHDLRTLADARRLRVGARPGRTARDRRRRLHRPGGRRDARAARRRCDADRGARRPARRRSSASASGAGSRICTPTRDRRSAARRPARDRAWRGPRRGARARRRRTDRLRRGRRRGRVGPALGWLGLGESAANGVRTDAGGRTTLPGVFAAGDVAAPFDPRLGIHSRSRALGCRRLAGRRRRRLDAGPLPGPAAAAELLERPVRDPGPLHRPRGRTATASSSRATSRRATSSPSSPATRRRSARSPSAGRARSRSSES